MAKKPNYTARRTVAAGLASGLVVAAGRAHSLANPEWVPKVTKSYVPNPEGGGDILRETYGLVEPHIPAAGEIAHQALTSGLTAAGIAAGATLAYNVGQSISNRRKERKAEGAHSDLNDFQFKKFKKIKY